MNRETLRKLSLLNQLALTEPQKEAVIGFFAKADSELEQLNAIDTENVERMVHVMPILTVVREDVVSQPYTPAELQAGAADVDEDYWCVPRVLE